MTIIGDWFRCQNTEASRINDWLQQDSVDGQSRLQIYSLYTGHSKSHILDGHTLSIMKRVENNGDCQSDQHSPSKRPLPTVANDNAKKQRRDDQSSSSAASGMTSQVPAVLCYGRVLRVHLVSDVLTSLLRRHIHKDACLRALEAGGGGDCLFHSIGAAFQQMSQGGHGPARHIQSRRGVGMFQQSTQLVVKHLRSVVAASLDADSGDLVVALTRSSAIAGGSASAEILMPFPQGASCLVALKNALREEFHARGHRHWGTHTDCNAISERFDVGMLIFADSFQTRGAQCLVNVDALRGSYA